MQELLAWLQDLLQFLGPYRYTRAVAVVALFLLLAFVASLLVTSLLNRTLGRWPEHPRTQLVRAAETPVFLSVLFMGLILGLEIVEAPARIESISNSVLETVMIFVWLIFAGRSIRIALDALQQRPPIPTFAQPATAPLLRNSLVVVMLLVGAYAVLLAWDVDVTGLVASAGILGIAISFAAQDTLGNLVSGISILTDKPYRIGDYIVLDTGERGAVTHIGLRSTRLLTRDDVEVSIPNGVMGKAKIINESGGPGHKYRLRIPVQVAYGSDIDQVQQLMLEAALVHEKVAANPEPRMRLRGFGDGGVEFEMLCWIDDPAQRGLISHELNCAIYKAFGAAHIRIAFPRREIRMVGETSPNQMPDVSP